MKYSLAHTVETPTELTQADWLLWLLAFSYIVSQYLQAPQSMYKAQLWKMLLREGKNVSSFSIG
jgi:hypothetical protein